MNENRKSFGAQLEAFFEGKGFYIVLFLCAAVIGVSAWVLAMGTHVEQQFSDIRSAGVAVTAPERVEASTEPTMAPVILSEPSAAPTIQNGEEAVSVWVEKTPEMLFVWPVVGDIVTPYAVDSLIYDRTMADWRTHGGIDISAPLGTHVLAAANGKVTSVEADPLYGTTVTIEHGDGVESIYANLSAQPTVYVGDSVSVGDVIGAVGSTAIGESALGTHLHFSMRAGGESADPLDYLP
jgi:murein DD-endopeptidase MepM/ murein hydrolase activator NlpD